MKMDVQEFIDRINDEKFEVNSQEISAAELAKNPETAFKPLLQFMEEQINLGHLASAMLQVKGEETSFFLQNCIVNLPYRYSKNISKMMSGDGKCELNIYMFVESKDVNRSSLRIDELASQDEFTINDVIEQKLSKWTKEQLNSIDENKKARLEAEKEITKESKPKKKKTTKK
ncbi:hypothetical protein MOO46_04715 [Apilactobacillus apisilvae]|uniref:Uncharacterized protein n=1 Tax=Apilactobacillus apisilvae TaxID=2923364 RepID=A0ABY4PFH5_9LACO|nr:hypothetical protein [Apilactobacillus apisilvae]UQS84558.1 hypothetical protein MOO46_04715 [Apilactobacillus apisilvae]